MWLASLLAAWLLGWSVALLEAKRNTCAPEMGFNPVVFAAESENKHWDLERVLNLLGSVYELKSLHQFLFNGVSTVSMDALRLSVGVLRDTYLAANPINQDPKVIFTFSRRVDGDGYHRGVFETDLDPLSEFGVHMKGVLSTVDVAQIFTDMESHIRSGLAQNIPLSQLSVECKIIRERVLF